MPKAVFKKGTLRGVVLIALGVLVAYVAWTRAWATHGDRLDPIRPGIDRCSECGMIVSDVRNSISVLDQDEQGHWMTRHFDDPGCFEKFKKTRTGHGWNGVARDSGTGKEIPINQAQFLKTGGETAMGSGLIVQPVDHP